jgi:hypothetical protein
MGIGNRMRAQFSLMLTKFRPSLHSKGDYLLQYNVGPTCIVDPPVVEARGKLLRES